jgi:surfactin synthase thioesterase subunit
VNDPDRTRQAFMDDPPREGERLYRAGDYGRWLPDGKLEFLGRRDTQVKVRGFRIEIGEIESTLARVPGVESGAVVVAGGDQLVAFHCGDGELTGALLRDRLAETLPEYMLPSAFHLRERLPLTGNGKVDRKALTELAGQLDAGGEDRDAPATPAEQRIAAAWTKVLGVPAEEIGRQDDFFDRGGTSLTAVKLVIALDREVSLKDVTRLPVLADQARLVDGTPEPRPGLLQCLSEPDGTAGGALVCFPYAGGNAVNFQPLAGALRGSGLAVYAVELPGHDVAAEDEPFAPMADLVEHVADEIAALGLGSVLLWGHSTGSALAVETARELIERRVHVERVFVGAQTLGDAAARRRAVVELNRRSHAEIAAWLGRDGGHAELGQLDAQRAEHIGAAYRHDILAAHPWFVDALEAPPPVKLSAPLTVVVAADDPSTADLDRCRPDWQRLAARVDVHELSEGGHYFLRTRPAEVAQAVWHASRAVALS